VLLIGTVMTVLDFFVVNVALPSIQHDLHTTAGTLEWVVAAYGLPFAVLLVTAGRVGDRIGRRRLFLIGLGGFVAASALCGVAPNAAVLIVARSAQGAASALISTSVLAIITASYPGNQRARALGAYGLAMGLGAACGQLVGGVLIQVNVAGLGWRSIFLINIPIGVVGLLLGPRHIPESRATAAARLDPVGMALSTAGLTAIVLPLIEGRQYGWPAWTWISLSVGMVLLAVLVVHQRWSASRGGSVLYPPDAFKDRHLVRGLLTQGILWAGQASFFLVFALYLQEGRRLSPLNAGLVFTIMAASYLIVSTQAPKLAVRFGRDVVTAGAAAMVVGYVVLVLTTHASGEHGSVLLIAPALLILGGGMALCLAPLATVVVGNTVPERAGMVSGLLTTMQQVGNCVGVAVISMLFFNSLHGGYPHAFEISAATLGGLLAVVGLLTRWLPARRVG
jgi:EmrB/QacA subfamily drug resistance transporter